VSEDSFDDGDGDSDDVAVDCHATDPSKTEFGIPVSVAVQKSEVYRHIKD
jgi:hypothetical protein